MTVLVEEVGISLAVTLSVVDTVGDAVGDGVGNVVGNDVGDVVGEKVGASDGQHVSAHSSATLGTMHWFVWRSKLQLGASRTSGKRDFFNSAHTGLDVGVVVGDTAGEDVGASVVQRLCTQLRNTRYVALVRLPSTTQYIDHIGEARNV